MDQAQQLLLRKRRRGLLRMYYGVDDGTQGNKQENVLDINSTYFKANKYLEQMYKTCDLQHLKMEKEKTKSGKLIFLLGRFFVCMFVPSCFIVHIVILV